MSQIQERIAKLLALADSPNEHEAQAALLKARELMAEYKLRPEEIQATGKAKVIVKTVGITCTAMTDSWVSDLSAIIAGRYCCKAYRNRRHNGKKMEIGFAGLEDDYEICRRIFLYAYDCIKSRCREIKSENRAKGISGSVIREMCNAYGQGFVDGLCSAFQKQQEEHQEWGLVMAVPQAVNDATSHHKRATALRRARTDGWRMAYARAGYKDGTEFDVDHRLAPAQGAGQTAMPKHCEFAAAVRLEPGVYQNVQRMLALESFSKMSAERRQELGIRTDSEEQLLWVSYKIRVEKRTGSTAKDFYSAVKKGEAVENLLEVAVEDGEVIEIDSGLKSFYFQYLGMDVISRVPFFEQIERRKPSKPGTDNTGTGKG